MKKYVVMTVFLLIMTGCAYDPVNYEHLRMQENAQHDFMMG